MTAIVVSSVSSQRRTSYARAWLEAQALDRELLLVGATLDGANELARQVARVKGAAFGWHRLSLAQLVAASAAPTLAARGLVPLSRIATEAIVIRLVHRLKAESKLGRYQPVSEMPGFSRAISGVIAELRSAGLQSNAVEAAVPDLVPIIREYERELTEGGLIDWPGTIELATSAVAGIGPPRLAGLPTLLVDVPILTEAELGFLAAFASGAPEVHATVPAGDAGTLERLRERLGFNFQDLDGLEVDASRENSAVSRLQCYLFNEHQQPLPADSGEEIEIFSAPGEGRECVEIARRVLALAGDGVPFDRIAVLLRSPEVYRSYLAEAFSRSNIPVHFARGAVRPDPAGRAFCALLESAAENLSAQKFAEYLSLAQVPNAVASGQPPEAPSREELWVAPDSELSPGMVLEAAESAPTAPDEESAAPYMPNAAVQQGKLRSPRRWERWLVEAAVIGGRDRWRRRLEGLTNELRRRLAEVDGHDENQVAAISREIENLTAFSSYALPLIDELDSLPVAAPWRDWLDKLAALAARSLKQPQRVLAVLAELEPMASVGPVGLEEVLAVLRNLLLEISERPPSQRYGKVFVGPVDAARGLSFDAVLVPGLAEKIFPTKIVEEPILLDVARKQISTVLTTNQTRLDRERLALSLAAGAAEQRIYFSYPRIDLDQGRSRVPSFYALEAVRSAEGRLPDFAELARRAETVAANRLGWPAPSDPTIAIDDAEHDLAVIDDLMNRPNAGAGRAHYLLTANPYLGRALRSRYRRWQPRWSSADGLLNSSAPAKAIMARHVLSARSFSPTALQNFSRCPYSFFIQAIHGIAPREIPFEIDDLDPLQRGSLIHDVQFELFARLTAENLLPVRPGNLDRVRLLLEQVIAEVASRHEDELAPAIDQVWQSSIAAIRADLREWLRRMSADTSGFVPRHFEMSFGLPDRGGGSRRADPRSASQSVQLDCGIQLCGSIDLVEYHPSGLFRVTDHKTGKHGVTGDLVIDGGRSLQPVLYALAAEKIFADEGAVSEGRLYFCTTIGQFSQQVVVLDEHARNAAAEVANAIGEAIERPFLPAAPSEGQCASCDYRPVCGPYEELRSARKPQEDLQLLYGVRAWK